MDRKKLKVLVMLGLCSALATGCKATPKEKTVVQKDTNKMIQKAEQKPTDENNQKKIAFTYKDSFSNKLKTLKINMDLKCEIPDMKYPIVRVKQREFTQKEVDQVVNELIGDSKFLKLDYEPSKQQIQDEIIELKKDSNGSDGTAFLSDDRNTVAKEIKLLKKMLAKAPDKVTKEEASRKLVDTESGTRVRGYTEETNGRKKYLDVENGCIPGVVDLTYMYMPNANSQTFMDETHIGGIEEKQLKKMKLTKEEAIKKAEELLKKLHINDHNEFGQYEVRIAYDMGNIYQGQKKDIPYYYMIIFTRNFHGITSAYGDQYFQIGNNVERPVDNYLSLGDTKAQEEQKKDDSYTMDWDRETISVYIGDEGVVGFHWTSPYKVQDTVVKSSNLLPMNKIKHIIKKMMLIRYEPSKNTHGTDELFGTTMKLELERVTEKDSKMQGLYVPTWNIYGDEKFTATSKDAGDLDMKNRKLISINAIDGSIIEIPTQDGCVG
ncbi:hypothetical protein lbkm_2696 [Lachnospiraceae bacterium KM106-2]|nr:hypothetical protein lbkm_2696 [Lachnospiraceae bacterium KM106-2]